MASPNALATQLAPTGVLRAAINFGNPVLAHCDGLSGEARGVSVDLAHELAHRTALPLRLVTFDAAGKVFDAIPSRVAPAEDVSNPTKRRYAAGAGSRASTSTDSTL